MKNKIVHDFAIDYNVDLVEMQLQELGILCFDVGFSWFRNIGKRFR